LHGPRSCIGKGSAKAEFRALDAAFVGCFEMEMIDPGEKVIVSDAIGSEPKVGVRLWPKRVQWRSRDL
jgi:hypothetical protein